MLIVSEAALRQDPALPARRQRRRGDRRLAPHRRPLVRQCQPSVAAWCSVAVPSTPPAASTYYVDVDNARGATSGTRIPHRPWAHGASGTITGPSTCPPGIDRLAASSTRCATAGLPDDRSRPRLQPQRAPSRRPCALLERDPTIDAALRRERPDGDGRAHRAAPSRGRAFPRMSRSSASTTPATPRGSCPAHHRAPAVDSRRAPRWPACSSGSSTARRCSTRRSCRRARGSRVGVGRRRRPRHQNRQRERGRARP